jgi:hypothetical protein
MSVMIELLFRTRGPETVHHFNKQCKHPMQTQQQLLLDMLKRNGDTAIGRKLGFASISSVEDFRKTIPIMDYKDHEPFIQRSLEGEPSQLTAQSPSFYATTSGTTGTPKYIPVTPESRSAKSQLLRVWLSKLFLDHPKIFSGRMLSVVSPEVESMSSSGVPCGAESGHGYRSAPKPLKAVYSSPYDTFEIEDYDSKYYTLLRIAVAQSVSFLFSCNPSTVLLLAQRMDEFADDIINDIRNGTLSENYDVPAEIRSECEPYLKADPSRADELDEIRQRTGALRPREVWPDLCVIACWKGGSVGTYLKKFNQYFPDDVAVRDLGYLSSENRGSIPLTDAGISGPLSIATNFFEFLPEDHEGKPQGQDLLTVDQLEEGKNYYIYVTTLAGLYRYDMNDIVQVMGYYENTPMIRFLQKGKGVVSFTGEKLYESQVIQAVEQALKEISGQYEFITALGKLEDDTPRYTFLIEFDNPPGDDQAMQWLQDIEMHLQKLNIEYHGKRASKRLLPAAMEIIKPGEFASYRKRMVEGGKLDGQFKTLKLTRDTQFAAEFETERTLRLEA